MTSGIYRITCVPTGNHYIGSSIHIEERWRQHRTEMRGGYHSNPHLQRSWNKYGEPAFTFVVLEECSDSRSVLLSRE